MTQTINAKFPLSKKHNFRKSTSRGGNKIKEKNKDRGLTDKVK